MALYCKDCGTVGEPVKKTSGSVAGEALMWIVSVVLCFILPPLGIIALIMSACYSVWRLFFDRGSQVCPKCGGKSLIPSDSPLARASIPPPPPVATTTVTEQDRAL